MDEQFSWVAWNRRFQQWTAANPKHEALKQWTRQLAAIDQRLAAKVDEAAALQRAVEQTSQERLRALIIALLRASPRKQTRRANSLLI